MSTKVSFKITIRKRYV